MASTVSLPSVTCTVTVPVRDENAVVGTKLVMAVLPSTWIRCTESMKSGSPTPTVTT